VLAGKLPAAFATYLATLHGCTFEPFVTSKKTQSGDVIAPIEALHSPWIAGLLISPAPS